MIHDNASQAGLTVLAATSGEGGANSFLNSSLGTAVTALCGAAGVLVVLSCIFKVIKHVTSGKAAEAFKVIVFGFLLAGALFQPQLAITGAKTAASFLQKALQSFSSVTGG
jgi:hypothetical protein